MECWDAHIPVERHRGDDVAAIEKRAPSEPESEPRRVTVESATPANSDDILVVASKVRKYIGDRSGMNTSSSAYTALSDRIRRLCERAIEEAKRQGRKTVMDRDIP